MSDAERFAGIVAAAIKQAVDPLVARIALLETRAPMAGRDGLPGVPGSPGVQGEKGLQGDRGRDGIDGKDGAPGLDGKDGAPGRDGVDGKDGLNGVDGVNGRDGIDGKDGAPGQDGRDGADGAQGRDGRDGVDGKDGAVGERGPQGEKGESGLDGKDGHALVDAFIDKEGWLVLTLSNGETKVIARVVGADGMHGKDGRDGIDGKDGKDGVVFGVEDLLEEADFDPDTRMMTLHFAKDGVTKDVRCKLTGTQIGRGIWDGATRYDKGDLTTIGGSQWLALNPNVGIRPGSDDPTKSWVLVVKHGRQGERGAKGETGASGKDGRDGRDLTQMDFSGRKW